MVDLAYGPGDGSAASPVALLALGLTLVGCGGSGSDAAHQTMVRDSAGVQLVTPSATPVWSEAEAWTTGEELVVGGTGDDGQPAFGYVVDLAVDDEGRIFVLDQQAATVYSFDPAGEVAAILAGPGEGPGEIGPLAASVFVRGDTVLVDDWSHARLTRFTTQGDLIGVERVPGQGGARTWWVATSRGIYYRSLSRITDGDGRWRGRDVLLHYRGEAGVDTVLVFDYEETDLGVPGAPRVPLLVNAPSWTVVDGGGVAWLTPMEGRLRIHGPDGTLRRIVARPEWTMHPPAANDVERLKAKLGDRLELLGGSRDVLEALPVDAPERLPAVTSVVSGPGGTLWVQRVGDVEQVHPMALNTPDPPRRFGGNMWDVLDDQGRHLGTLELPYGFHLLELTETALYGVARDSLDVERVVRLALVR